MKVVYIGNSDGCMVATPMGCIEVRYGQSIELSGVQLDLALSSTEWVAEYLYDE